MNNNLIEAFIIVYYIINSALNACTTDIKNFISHLESETNFDCWASDAWLLAIGKSPVSPFS